MIKKENELLFKIYFITVSSPSSMSVSSITSSTLRKDDHEDEEGLAGDNNEKVCVGNSVSRQIKSCFQNGNIIEGEDTMKNLRTTFAGLFGDLK